MFRSTARQNTRVFATAKGWTVLDDHIYIDDGVSDDGDDEGQWNFDAADSVLADIHTILRTLAASPQIGHRRSDLTARPLRFHVVRDEYLIAYAPTRSRFGWCRRINGPELKLVITRVNLDSATVAHRCQRGRCRVAASKPAPAPRPDPTGPGR